MKNQWIGVLSAILIWPIFHGCLYLQQVAVLHFSVNMPENPANAAYVSLALQLLPWLLVGFCVACILSQPQTPVIVFVLLLLTVVSIVLYCSVWTPVLQHAITSMRPSLNVGGIYMTLTVASLCLWFEKTRSNRR